MPLALVACCLTPYGPEPLLMPLTTLSAGHALGWIGEWRPQDFGHVGAFELLLLAGIFALSRGTTVHHASSWLHAIAHRAALNALRSRAARVPCRPASLDRVTTAM